MFLAWRLQRFLFLTSYRAWTTTYKWKKLYGHEFLYGGPLFIHHLSHLWIDFRGIQDEYMSGKAIDYFENSRRAIYARRRMQYVTQRSSWATIAIHGESPRVMVLVRQFGELKVERYVSTTISHAPFPMDLTTARWHPGQLLALYHLPLKLCCPLSSASTRTIPTCRASMGLSAVTTRHSVQANVKAQAGFLKVITGWTRGRS